MEMWIYINVPCVHTMKYYSALKNEIMKLIGKWMELDCIISILVSQTQRDKCYSLSYLQTFAHFFLKCFLGV